MGAMNKSDGYQCSKNKAKFESQEKRNTWATHKAIRISRDKKRQNASADKAQSRIERGKPVRGHARKLRRSKQGISSVAV